MAVGPDYMKEPNFVKDKDKIMVLRQKRLTAFDLTLYSFLRMPGWVSAHFRRDEFTFLSFEAENRVRIAVSTRMQRQINPVAGFAKNRGIGFAGKERVNLSLVLPVFTPLKTKEISERPSRKPPYVRPGQCSGRGRVRHRRANPAVLAQASGAYEGSFACPRRFMSAT